MYHNIRILSSRHDVHVISFVINDEERERLRTVNSIAKSVTAVQRIPDFRPHWLSLKPFLVREFSTPEMRLAMEKIMRAERIDLVQCEYLQMAQFRVPHMPAVLTAHEALSQNAHGEWQRETVPAMKFQLFYRWMQMLRYETLEVARFNRVVTMTEQDARYLRSYVPKAHIQPIPIGVDTAEFSPAAEDCAQPLSVLFVGNFLHSPNVEAARFLVDEMAPRFPQIQFRIPGDNVPENLRAKDNVEFPGYIADTRTLYKRPNTIVVAPLFSGTGQRVKMLEAFAMGCPVVTTSLGAAGYPARGGV
jgi:glycosyltransferase involved in cell wall biosynthesis